MSHLHMLKDHFKEAQLYSRRAFCAILIGLILISILVGRLIFLQVVQYDLYKTLSLSNQVRIVPLVPNRGLIFDRNGVVLSENIPAFSLEITPERASNMAETLKAIQTIIPLTPTELNRFYKQLHYKRRSEGIPLRLKLSEEEVAKFSIQKYRFAGVDIVARLIRSYPFSNVFAHATGTVGPISEKEVPHLDPVNYRGTYMIGKTGIEKFYEKTLHGKVGYQHVETDAKGRTIRILKRILPIPGKHLHLSLDSHLQQAAYQAMQDLKGAVVAIEPDSGALLALVSTPSFDPNLFSQGIDSKTYKALQESEEKPLFNRVLQAQYPPGSTIKPLVALKALESGIITPEFTLFDPGWYQLHAGGRLYRDWIYHRKKHGHGLVNLEKALIQSCDTYFFTVAHKLGSASMAHVYQAFGLGRMTSIDSAAEVGGLVATEAWKQKTFHQPWYPGDTLNMGIGQGFLLATPLQIAQVASLIANRGHSYKPRLVDHIEEEQNTQFQTIAPQAGPYYLSTPKNWDLIIDAMQQVVHSPSGTAYRISKNLSYTMAGKTGTAQVFNLKQNEKYVASKIKAHLRDHSWFIAFAPAKKPRIAIAVLIENKQQIAGIDIARKVLDAFFKADDITTPMEPPSSPGTEDALAEENMSGGPDDAP